MKQLLLIRHGKSDWNEPSLSDHDRVLNERGLRDTPRMAAALKERGLAPDLVVTSSAVRADTTARGVAEGLGYPPDSILVLPELYLASPRTILRVVQRLDESAATVLLFGHNPGLHEAANLFVKGAPLGDFPTLAVARIEFSAEHWGSIEWGEGRLVESLVPRGLAEG
jgi:phosphohistidine phosphatase